MADNINMNSQLNIEELAINLLQIMNAEIIELDTITKVQQDIRNCIISKREKLSANEQLRIIQVAIDRLRSSSKYINGVDSERDRVFNSMKVKMEINMNSDSLKVFDMLPPHLSKEMKISFEKLKSGASRVKWSTDHLLYTLRSISGTLTSLIREIIPERRVETYSSGGIKNDFQEDSLLLNQVY